MKKMQDRHPLDRPREKLARKGVASLSDLELLMAIIGSGNAQADVGQISKRVLKLIRTHGADLRYSDLAAITGLGAAKITVILANLELARRYLIESDRPIIDCLDKAAQQCDNIRDKKQEHVVCLTLDGANRLIAKRIITVGTLTASLVHPREIFTDAITDRAASVIVAHNHPSGQLKASTADREVTRRLSEAGNLIGISLIDHLIVTKHGAVSIINER